LKLPFDAFESLKLRANAAGGVDDPPFARVDTGKSRTIDAHLAFLVGCALPGIL
jgi:hypothetical protein